MVHFWSYSHLSHHNKHKMAITKSILQVLTSVVVADTRP